MWDLSLYIFIYYYAKIDDLIYHVYKNMHKYTFCLPWKIWLFWLCLIHEYNNIIMQGIFVRIYYFDLLFVKPFEYVAFLNSTSNPLSCILWFLDNLRFLSITSNVVNSGICAHKQCDIMGIDDKFAHWSTCYLGHINIIWTPTLSTHPSPTIWQCSLAPILCLPHCHINPVFTKIITHKTNHIWWHIYNGLVITKLIVSLHNNIELHINLNFIWNNAF